MEERRAHMEEMKKQIADIHRIITGNGHPEDGLLFKVAQHNRFIVFWEKLGWVVVVAVVGIWIKTLFS